MQDLKQRCEDMAGRLDIYAGDWRDRAADANTANDAAALLRECAGGVQICDYCDETDPERQAMCFAKYCGVKVEPAPDHSEWNAAIEAAAKVADVKPRKGGKPLSGPHHQGLRDGRAEAARLIRSLKKGQTDEE